MAGDSTIGSWLAWADERVQSGNPIKVHDDGEDSIRYLILGAFLDYWDELPEVGTGQSTKLVMMGA